MIQDEKGVPMPKSINPMDATGLGKTIANRKSCAAVADVMEKVFDECRKLREAGQKEYAHDEENAFANFEDDADAFGISREMDLLIFANKHWRGVRAWARGHRSQREDVRGRINDLIVYLVLLRAMADEGANVANDALVKAMANQPKRSG